MKDVTKWIVPIMGYRESAESETGIEKVWRGLRALVDNRVFVMTPYEWDEATRGAIDFILRNSPDQPELMVVAYSWGCGVGFTGLARDAERAGLRIRYAILCDPVYRSRIFPSWLPINPLSISPIFRPKIRIPSSVERVEWVRQKRDIPCGHDLLAEDPWRTKIGIPRFIDVGHREIDESPQFVAMVEFFATAFIYGHLITEDEYPDKTHGDETLSGGPVS